MSDYSAPLQEVQFVINELAGMGDIAALSGFEEASPELVAMVLEEAGKLASGVLAPLNHSGDKQGAKLVDGVVETTKGFKEAYQQFVEGGWMGIAQEEKYGGQGLPFLLHSSISEIWQSANMAFALNPMLSCGAIKALVEHGSDGLKEIYLPNMVNGSWTGTMNLTEPQAGSDLAAVRTKATPKDDHYLIEGQKIFITWGDHEMTENIVHLVLARLPDAPEGVKGISLFIVPKFLVNADGSIGERNDVRTVSLEHKLGIHGSPTCMMSFGDNDGALGYLVGRENDGLAHMFTMMNDARLAVGIEGVSISERAYQQARYYAQDRVQGFAPGHEGRVTIIHHPDVRRMLMLMRSLTEAARALCYVTAAHTDFIENSEDPEQVKANQQRLDLLVPVAKGWCTEIAQEVCSLGVQIHGGMGFVEETGAAQHFRDARILTIYEGTTGIQGLDLVGRKMLRDRGAGINDLLQELKTFAEQLTSPDTDPALHSFQAPLNNGIETLAHASNWLLTESRKDPSAAGTASVNLLMLIGTVLGGYQMIRAAMAAQQHLNSGSGNDGFHKAKIITARFYTEHVLPRSKAYLETILAGPDSTMALPLSQF